MTRAILKDAASNTNPHDLTEIWGGLSGSPKRLPCKLFYDAHGSRLFERITRLPEYYPTRTEIEILREHGAAMATTIGTQAVVVEFGSGASLKTRLLLDALEQPRVYVPIDISREMLLSSAEALRRRYPKIDVRPVIADYTRDLELPLETAERQGNIVAFFPGSTIGNFEQAEAVTFLRRMRRACGEAARILIGVDVPKTRSVLEAAYADAAGVTARFNLNVLRVLNRDYGANFRLEDFVHRAVWNEDQSRVEMHLLARRPLGVRVGARTFQLQADEPIVTEHCYKYGLGTFRDLAQSAGFDVTNVWLDPQQQFSVQLLAPAATSAE